MCRARLPSSPQRVRVRRGNDGRSLAGLLLLLAGGLAGCDVPAFEGPQVQSPPPGFTLNDETALEETLFPDRPLIYHDAWVQTGWGNFSGIYINGHPGVADREDVVAAQERIRRSRSTSGDWTHDFGAVEDVTVDGREAFGWSEMLHSPAEGIESVSYRMVVPYDTVTFTVEFISGDPSFKSRPDSLETVVASFAVGRVRPNLPLLLLGVGVLILLVARARTRTQEKAQRMAGTKLPRIERPDDDDESRLD